MSSLILKTAARFLMVLLLLFSVFLLLRGHNEPGGGFAGGLVAAAAFLLFAIADGVRRARGALRVAPQTLAGGGLLLALGAGLLGLLWGKPLLTGIWTSIPWPNGSQIKIGTPLLFDVGVYFTVLGVVLTILLALAEELPTET